MPGPLLLGVPLIPVAINAVVGIAATVAATRLIGDTTPTFNESSVNATPNKSIKFWEDGIDAKEAAMIGAVGLSALAMASFVARRKS